ncbi:3307_t:CDS:2, partial [Gigaspora margarita]
SKELEVVLEKVKAHSGDKQNERADRIAKEESEAERSLHTQEYKRVQESAYRVVKRVLANNIGSSIKRMNVSKNKACDVAVAFLDEWKETKKREEKRRKPEEKKKRSNNLEEGTGEKEIVLNDRKPK